MEAGRLAILSHMVGMLSYWNLYLVQATKDNLKKYWKAFRASWPLHFTTYSQLIIWNPSYSPEESNKRVRFYWVSVS